MKPFLSVKQILVLAILALGAGAMHANELNNRVSAMIANDRTQLCLAVAVIDQGVQKTIACANPAAIEKRKLDYDTAFEIGSISKTMTSVVLAQLIQEQKLSLENDLADILPKGTRVPEYGGESIKLKHLVTHTSGLPVLPPGFSPKSMDDPYADLSKSTLLNSLSQVSLNTKPGTAFEYSNYAMMLLSLGLSESTGKPFSSLVQESIFTPLSMQNSTALRRSKGLKHARGHSQLGKQVSAWRFKEGMQGVGGIRASLNDMVSYAQANLQPSESPIGDALALTHQEVKTAAGVRMGMNWMIQPMVDSEILMHEGGTGGFSALVAIDKTNQKAVVVLSDTAITSLGGLSAYALSLMGESETAVTPRLEQAAPIDLLEALAGAYTLPEFGLGMKLWHENGMLKGQASGQPSFRMLYDSHGSFYPDSFDALLSPIKTANGQSFTWSQGGGVARAERQDAKPIVFKVAPEVLTDYVGTYPLVPGFALIVATKDNQLTVQGTGQSPLTVAAIAEDEFSQDDVGAHFTFHRDAGGQVTALTLRQNGQELKGEKQ